LALTESLRAVPKVENALNAMSRCKEKINSGLSKNAGYHLLKIYEVFNGESPIDRCTEHRWIDTLKVKYATIVACDDEVSQNIRTYSPTTGGNFVSKLNAPCSGPEIVYRYCDSQQFGRSGDRILVVTRSIVAVRTGTVVHPASHARGAG
jgi:hypothetical protein